MGAGLVATVTLDIILIPRFEATGAAVASAVAYVTTALALLVFFRRVERAPGGGAWSDARLSSADAG
jgi:Na+-driven multidrug efflux pump